MFSWNSASRKSNWNGIKFPRRDRVLGIDYRSGLIENNTFYLFVFRVWSSRRRKLFFQDVFLCWSYSFGILEDLRHRISQLQQTPTQSDLSQRCPGGILQLYASNFLEFRMSTGLTQLSNPWLIYAIESRPIWIQRKLRVRLQKVHLTRGKLVICIM